jgi:tetratricopeptide (TPR) repeat protein
MRPPNGRAGSGVRPICHEISLETMATITQLKQKAREWERREQWKSALDAYEQVTREANGSEELEVGVWNRIGDLHMRLAQPEQAVTAYERAADAYADAGLHNNAIALCNKILRSVPDSTPVLLKLAQISALKGFVADARQCVSRFVAHCHGRGGMEATLELLVRTAAKQPPESANLRFVVAETLQSSGRSEQALALFREARRILLQSGDEAGAARVQEQMEQLAPARADHRIPENPPHRTGSSGGTGAPGADQMPLLYQTPLAVSPSVHTEAAASPPDSPAAGDDRPFHERLPLLGVGGAAADCAEGAELPGLLGPVWEASGGDHGATPPDEAPFEPLPLLGLLGAEPM